MEIVVRAVIIWLFLWFVTRISGKRELTELSPFELLLLVTMGDLVQQGVTQEDMSITAAMLAVGTFALLSVVTSYAAYRWTWLRGPMEGMPVVVVQNGRIQRRALHLERLTEEELLEAARQQGIADLKVVRLGVLEPDGKFSFIQERGERPKEDESPKAAG